VSSNEIQLRNILSSTAVSKPILGHTQPHIQRAPGVKRLEHVADHSPPSSAEVKNA